MADALIASATRYACTTFGLLCVFPGVFSTLLPQSDSVPGTHTMFLLECSWDVLGMFYLVMHDTRYQDTTGSRRTNFGGGAGRLVDTT